MCPEVTENARSQAKRTFVKILASSFLASFCLFAQTTGATFEVATVKASPPNDGRYIRGCKGGPGTSDPGLWRCTNATIAMLIARAYDIQHYQLAAPDWTANVNYEISAKVPLDTSKEQFREMIRNLLSDRFKLEFHWSKKEMPVYDLMIAKGGPKLKEWADKPEGEGKDDPPAGKGGQVDADGYPVLAKDCSGCMTINAAGKARYRATKESLKEFADMIGNQLGMPANDRTGLTGKYDITLSWSSGGGISRRPDAEGSADPGITMEAAVQQQLGLKLVSTKGQVDIIVVDKVDRNPGEN
jgi:uncharacterized protein (TIGR03435 family)